MHSKSSKTKRIVAGVVGIAMTFAFVLPAQAATVEELTAQINSLLSTISALQSQLSSLQGGPSSPASSCTFTRDLTVGAKGADVTCLQNALIAAGHSIPAGATGYFGAQTQAAVAAWQKAKGVTPSAGYFGAKSRAAFGTMAGPGPGPGPVVPAGSSLSVAAAQQPAAQLAPASAARVPFTRFVLTAGSSDVTVNSVTVTRVGPGNDAAFAGVVLVDENGMQIGLSKTLNSNHQANVGEPFVVKAGTSRTLTIAGNMASSLTSYAGEVPTFQVTAINTSAPVVGSLPITGTGQTTNATLTLGSVTKTISYDSASQSKSIGTTNFRYSTIRFTASAEDIRLHSIRWNQSGSASASDLANVMVEVDGVKYPTTVSADGKYYSALFGPGVVIAKGFSKDISIVSDLVGGPNRTVQFDIYRTTDVYLTGGTYGYGVTPTAGTASVTSGSRSAAQFTSGTPWFEGSTVTIQAGTVTTIGKATEVASQNIAVNVPNQVLGGFATEFTGEPVTISGATFNFNFSSDDATGKLLTNVTIVDQNGAVVAGPKDASDDGGTEQSVAFTDSITFPLGRHIYTVKGTVDPDVTNGQTITSSTTPSGWTSPTGQNTGNSVTISQGNFSMNSMTVRTATTSVTISSNPVSQNIVAGGQDVLFANLQLDVSQSGEDIRVSQIPLRLAVAGGAATTDLTGCQLFNGASVLNTGSNVPTSLDGTDKFTLDTPLTIPKGTVVTLALKCDVATAGTGTYTWSVNSGDATQFNTTGVTSSNSIVPSVTTGNSGTMTVASGSLAVSTDASSPGYTLATAGSSGVTLGVAKFRATNEAVNLTRVGLKLTNTASSSAADLVQVTLWDGSTQIGTAVFTGGNAHATSTLATSVNLPKDTDKAITVKGNLSAIGSSEPVTLSGHLVAVDVDSNTNTQGTGVGSGTTINSTGSTAVAGVRVFKSYPTIALDTLPTSAVAGSNVPLLRFKVTASAAGPISIAKLNTTLTTVSANATGLNMFAYTDSSYSQPVSGLNTGGQLMTSNQATTTSGNTIAFYPQTSAAASTTIQVPAGQTRYFEVRAATVTGTGSSYSVSAQLNGDAAYPAQAGGLTSTSTTVSWIDGGGNQYTTGDRDFIWSPNSTTTATINDVDWTNGYGLPGLPASGISHTRTQ